MLVSIVVPAYKQEKTIKEDLERIHNVMSQTRWDFEIIVVVDGLSDNTFQEAKKVKERNVKVYGLKNNHGKGYAIRYGIARSKGGYVAFIDAGMEIHPNGISMLLEHMEWYNADIVVGSKWHPASKAQVPPIRKLYSRGYHLGVKILFGLRLKDTQAGLKIYRREVLKKVMPRLLVKEFAFDIELLAVAQKLGFIRMYEAPVEISLLDSDNASKLAGARLFFNASIRQMLIDTLAIFYRLKILRYYDDASKRRWKYDKELDMRVNTGKLKKD
jgi:glycosyltransferase involved in cell wall biosynthesis